MATMMVLAATAGCTEEGNGNGDSEPVTFILAAPFVDARDSVSGEVYDATMDVNKVWPSDAEAGWTQVSVVIKDAFGSLLLSDTPVSKDSGMYSDTVEVWYVDEAGDGKLVDAGDAIKITGMDESYQGARVQVLHRGDVAASLALPTDFP